MRANAVIAPELLGKLSSAPTISMDIGSRQAKAVLLSDSDGEVHTATTATGVNCRRRRTVWCARCCVRRDSAQGYRVYRRHRLRAHLDRL